MKVAALPGVEWVQRDGGSGEARRGGNRQEGEEGKSALSSGAESGQQLERRGGSSSPPQAHSGRLSGTLPESLRRELQPVKAGGCVPPARPLPKNALNCPVVTVKVRRGGVD